MAGESIYRVTDLVGTSKNSWEDAVKNAVQTASKSLRDLRVAEVTRLARECRSLSEAGRRLFAVSRASKKAPNDADRLSKYLGRFGLRWEDLRGPRR